MPQPKKTGNGVCDFFHKEPTLAARFRANSVLPSRTPTAYRSPPGMRDDIQAVLLSETQIQQRLDTLAAEILEVYTGKDLTIIGVLTGSVMFVADLLKRLPIPLRLDNVGLSSYRGDTRAGTEMVVTKELRLDVRDRGIDRSGLHRKRRLLFR